MRLRVLLAASFAGLALGVSFAGSLTVQQIASVRVRARVAGQLEQLAGQVLNLLEAGLAERLSDMQVLATLSQTANVSTGARRAWVDAMRRVYPVYAWIGFAAPDGRVEASTDGVLEGADVSARPWFRAGLATPFVGELHEAVLLSSHLPPDPRGEPLRFVDVAAPVRDPDRGTIGVVGGHLSWRWVEAATREALDAVRRSDPETEIVVLSSSGEVLLAPPRLAGRPLPVGLVGAAERGGDALPPAAAWPDGRSRLVGIGHSTTSPHRPTLGWTVLALGPAERVAAASRALSLEIMSGGVAVAVAAALIGWWLAGRIARPLLALSEAATALGDRAGELPAPTGFREARQLTASMADLLRRLAQRDAALASANRDLEDRVVDRTRDLESERNRAERAGEAKAEFLANMSHELRTPLTGILSVHDLLRTDPALDDGQRRLIDLAHEAGRSLLVIVNDVLDLSKMEAGQLAIEHIPFDVRDLLEGCGRMAAGGAGGRDLVVRAEIAPELPHRLLGDPTRLRQVVLNLATNAVKFTPAGEVVIRAVARRDRLAVSVHDTGIGMAPDLLPNLFDRFSQGDGSTARRFGGTGLGLAICRHLVGLMGGTIAATSRPGEGSVFSFDLPLWAETGQPASALVAAPTQGTAAPPRRLLLAEDNDVNRHILSAVLTRLGHRVTAVPGGEEAVEAWRSGAFDVILMDVQMPVTDGLMATAAIRTAERGAGRRRTPVIALTANAQRAEGERCRRSGMDDHVAKPVDWAVLSAAIERLCGGEAEAAAPSSGLADPPVMDETVQQDLAGYIGADRLGPLLLAFRAETERRLGLLAANEATPGDLARHAHVIVSMSGQLGFAELSAFCARLERDASETGSLEGRLQRLRQIAGRALSAAATSRYAAT